MVNWLAGWLRTRCGERDGGRREMEMQQLRYPWIWRSRALGDSSSRRLGAYPIWKICLDRRISVESRIPDDTARGLEASPLETRKESVFEGVGEDQSTAYLPAKQSASNGLLFQIHPFEVAHSWRIAPRLASRLKYSPDKTVSFPSQSIFARPTHSRL